jgi:hypothetical protein
MDWRVRIPGVLFRRASQRAVDAGSDLQTITRALLALYAEAQIDPLVADPIAVAVARRGGHARAESMSATARSEAARKAVQARWAKRDQS